MAKARSPYQVLDRMPWQRTLIDRLGELKEGTTRVGYLYEEAEPGTFRYRCYNMAQAINNHSKKFSASYFFLHDLQSLDNLADFVDVLVLVRVRFDSEVDRLVRQFRLAKKPILFDLDDHIFDLNSTALLVASLNQGLTRHGRIEKWTGVVGRIRQSVALVDGILTTTTVTRRDAAAQNQLVFASGTSIASAFAAGSADIVLAANPAARPADVIQRLLASATPDVVSGVPPAMPNRLLYVGTGAQPAMAVGASATALGPVFSCVTAIFVPRSSSPTAAGRYELEGTVALPGVLTVTIGGRLLARRHIGAGEFSFLTRRIARGVSRVRFALKPDDRGTSVKSVLVRTVRWL